VALDFAARFHAFVNGIFRTSEAAETWALYTKTERLMKRHGLMEVEGRMSLAKRLAEDVAAAFDLPRDHVQTARLIALARDIFDYELLFTIPHIEWGDKHTVAEHFDLRDLLNEQRQLLENFETTCTCFKNTLIECLNVLYLSSLPGGRDTVDDGLTFETTMPGCLVNAGEIVEGMIVAFFDDDVKGAQLFGQLRYRLNRNAVAVSGGNPDEPERFNRSVKMPTASPIRDAEELCDLYLSGTPLLPFLHQDLTIAIPQTTRFEHTHVLGGTGHGKTQLLQHLIYHDLVRAMDNKMSVVVVDSQSDMIQKLSKLALFAPNSEGSLCSRFILIDPTDIDHPPALNLFDAGLDRLESYTPQQRELAFNSLVDIYGRFFGALLGSELTARQGAVFRYLARLMLTMEGATIHTLIELMDNVKPFQDHIKRLDPTAKRFFEQEFSRKAFNATRQQIKQRLYTVLSIPTFDRLFSAPHSKINFFDALNSGSIILVNTAKDVLKTDGAAIFGRFILSLIEHAIMERATLKESERTPTLLYVDEAQDYFDETIETLLVQGRKQCFGLILAHQNLAQLSPRLKAVLMGNTTIKLAGGVSDADARALSPDMRTKPEMLLAVKKQDSHSQFALSVRNQTPHAVKTDIAFGFLEAQDTMSNLEYETLLFLNREKVTYTPEVPKPDEGPKSKPQAATVTPETADSAPEVEHAGHRAIQEQIAAKAKKHGFAASVEYILPNDKRIDVALFGHGMRIALEVSVTNREGYELTNIEKALEAGFDTVWMVAPDAAHRDRLEKFVRKKLAMDKWSKVLFGSIEEVTSWLARYKAPPLDTSHVAGYEVEAVFLPPENAQDQQYRHEQLRRIKG